jgi:hypothetical protein
MEDITKALAYEIKQDIANRYFGFRKRIETESRQYLDDLQRDGEQYAAAIIMDMQRMHCLLQNEQLFSLFVTFTRLPDTIGSFVTEPRSPSRWQTLFSGLHGKGFTRKRRYRNLMYTVYLSLADSIDTYRDSFIRFTEEHEDICGEIDRFYRMNDLSGILSFLREIDNPDGLHSGMLQADRANLATGNIDQELRIVPPPPVTSCMYPLEQLPPLEDAKTTLDRLIKQAFPLFDHFTIDRSPF